MKPNPEFVTLLVEHLETYDLRQLDQLVNPKTGIQTVSKFLPTIAEIVEFFHAREFVAPRSGHGPNLTGAAEPDPRKLTTLEERKAFVIRELGYDPAKIRPSRACFIPPPPTVDISDFPATTSRAMDPAPDAKPLPETPPWRDKNELAKSMDRINRYMASKDYLFGTDDDDVAEAVREKAERT